MDFTELYYFSKSSSVKNAFLGLCYQHGWGTAENKEKALSIFLEGAEERDCLSRLCLADFYMEYSIEESEKAKAFSIYLELADVDKNTVASYKVAACFRLGFGVGKDIGLAWKYALSAAKLGYAQAQEMIGFMCLDQNEFRDIDAAHKWLEATSIAGMPSAAFRLGYLFETGEGVPIDFERATFLYKSAADLGGWAAHGRLAQAYRFGQLGLSVDFNKAEFHEKEERSLLSKITA